MSTHQRMFVLVSFFVLFRSVLSYYQDNSAEADNDQEDDQKVDSAQDMLLPWRGAFEAGPPYQVDTLRNALLKNDPKPIYVTSMNRKRDKMARLRTNKKNMMNNNMKDDMREGPGKSSLSIISPLEALQRKVAIVYNIRLKERNRGLLNDYGKRSSAPFYMKQSFSEPNEPVLQQSDNDKLKQYERRLYGLYRIP